ncbi:medium-chain fatty acid-CoA ligase faa2 [Coemansia sp. RSA 1972]|nr:medium-chain fatty acid-CoA ligase faa2 [Coemansia sp. RSA 1972]
MQAFKVPSSEVPGYSSIYRHPEYKDGTHGGAFSHITTLYELFQHVVDKYPKREFVGARKLHSWFREPTFGSYEWMTGKEVGQYVDEFGSGLDHVYAKYIGESSTDAQQPLGIYSINRPEWLITELAGFRSRRFSVGICDTVGVISAEYIINNSNTAVAVCSMDKIPRMLERIKETPGLKVIISMDKLDCSQKNAFAQAFNSDIVQELKERAASFGVTILDMAEVRQMGSDNLTAPSPPSPSDIFTTCYTSGTTGAQKGVMLSHGAFVHASKAYTLGFGFKDVTYLSFMPLVHSFDRVSIYSFFYNHVRIGFYSGDLLKVMDDMRVLKPTVVTIVPRLLNRIYERMASATIGAKGAVGMLSRAGLKSKIKRIDAGRSAKHALWDRLIFNKLSAMFGGRVGTLISGASSISSDVLTFFRAALSCDVVQAYAQTEASVACTAQLRGNTSADNVGVPLPGVDVRLRSVENMGYHVTNAAGPRGEVLIRGKCVFSQYMHEPEKTKEAKDGEWLATGDVGQINPDGTLSIIDRVKNILKTGQGTWVALERIEGVYSSHPLVHSVFVHGDELQRDLVAVVVPKADKFVDWATEFSKPPKDGPMPTLSSLCANQEVVKTLQQELKNYAIAAGLTMPEHINAIHCEPSPFEDRASVFLTSSSKVRRRVVIEHYKDELDNMFAKLDNSTAPTLQDE